MNTVTSLQTTCSRENIVRLFARFANKYGALWTNRLGANPDWDTCIDDWYEDLKHFEYKTLVLAAKSCLATFNEFPPTFGQFENLCKKHSGFLQLDDAVKMLIARDFSHPIVRMMYERIGSWTLSNGKETEVQAKAQEAYREAETEFTLYPEKCWAALEAYNAKPKELPAPSKNPSTEERKGFKQRLAEYYQKLGEQKINVQGKTYLEFDEKAIQPKHEKFDHEVFNAYRDYLLSIPDTELMTLPTKYQYDRIRFIGQREQADYLKKSGYVPLNQREHSEQPRAGNGKPTKMYKNWMND